MMKLLGVLAGAVLALGLMAPQAKAVVIYDFAGSCAAPCDFAFGTLTLADTYTPGTVVENEDFISFSYMSGSGAFSVPGDAVFSQFSGNRILPAGIGDADLTIDFVGGSTFFQSEPGFWRSIFSPAGIDDVGGANAWRLRAPVDPPVELSAPGPLSVLILGFAGLALARRRRKPGA